MESKNKKNEQTVYTTHGAFPFSYFHLAIERTKIIWRIIFLISVFCLRIRKGEKMLSNSFSILYYEIEKRKTKVLYIYGPICLLYIAGLRWGIVCVWHTITMVDKLIFLLVFHINSSIFLLIYSFICSFLYGLSVARCETVLIWMPRTLTNEKSALVHEWLGVIRHHLRQLWPRSMSPYGVPSLHWVNKCMQNTTKIQQQQRQQCLYDLYIYIMGWLGETTIC